MSTINVQPSKDAAASVAYVLYGNDKKIRERLRSRGQTRAAALMVSMANGSTSPADFVARAQRLAKNTGRSNELYSYVLAFHPDEFDVTSRANMERIRDIASALVERMHSADHLVVVHSDAAGGHGHAHILVLNHDNLTGKSLQRFTSWRHGLHQLNDDLMRDEGLRVLPDPAQPKPGWEQRREAFAPRGFEQTLGDTVFDALQDPRAIDQPSFETVLGEQGVTLAVTHRDGWSFKMRRTDNGRIGRKKASALTPDFTAEPVNELFRQRVAGIAPAPRPMAGLELEPDEFEQIALRLKHRMTSKTPQTPARERFMRGNQRQPQREREYGD
ncbi:relaxase/mobilization nuclease domain-containing protein [Salinibacterium sp. SWN167]|uniref:relaxase/mobilization nuclease domain-containing protein n=1 Tax=Salinibacterium sp. SWN167 TaxID=2792054 RepID=UPI0018CE3778|nr:relaxase/mobilization nuclease domain-containing protein [Salinibacterium sp. SWN167]MBH0083008.1 relaxase/mobilization nuclease domain-containing protein [Salinibacterium sp. SWN167]